MASDRITVRVPKDIGTLLRHRSRVRGQTPSDLVRIALEQYLGRERKIQSAYDAAEEAGLIGCLHSAPRDLSTNRKHFQGFGKTK